MVWHFVRHPVFCTSLTVIVAVVKCRVCWHTEAMYRAEPHLRMKRNNRTLIWCFFSTVHNSIELFHQPTLMHNFLYSLTNILLMNKEKCALKLVDERTQIYNGEICSRIFWRLVLDVIWIFLYAPLTWGTEAEGVINWGCRGRYEVLKWRN